MKNRWNSCFAGHANLVFGRPGVRSFADRLRLRLGAMRVSFDLVAPVDAVPEAPAWYPPLLPVPGSAEETYVAFTPSMMALKVSDGRITFVSLSASGW